MEMPWLSSLNNVITPTVLSATGNQFLSVCCDSVDKLKAWVYLIVSLIVIMFSVRII
jgi:hypothetical protein